MGKIDLNIRGMHCRSCEVLLEQNIKKIHGVERVHVDYTTGKAVIVTTFSSHIARLKSIIECGKKMNRKVVFLGSSLQIDITSLS